MGRQGVAAKIIALIVTCAAAGCGGQKQEYGDDVLAVVNGHPITVADIQARLEALPEDARKEFNNPSMLSAFINSEIGERVWAEAAREAGFDKTEEYQRSIRMAENAILAQMYSAYVGQERAEPTEQEINEAYEREKGQYYNPQVHARHILCSDESKAKEAAEAIGGGLSFEEAVSRYSEDPQTKDKSGDLGTISRSTAIPGMGVMPDFFDALAELDPGQVAGPIRTRRGYHVVQVLSKDAGQRMPPEALRAQIARRLRKERSESGVSDLQSELWKKYDVQAFDVAIKKYIGYPVTPEQFVRHIQEATSTGDKVELCKQLVSQFPSDKYAPWGQFMLGFVLSEELHNYLQAEEEFRTLLQRYPNSGWAEPARWMIANMTGQHPPLRNPDHVKALARGR